MMDTVKSLYLRVWQQQGLLLRASWMWLLVAYVGQVLAGPSAAADLSVVSPLQIIGLLLHVFAVLAAWYCAHRAMIDSSQPEWKPGTRQLRFVGTQVVNVLALALLASVLLTPLVVWLSLRMPDLQREEIMRHANTINWLAFPFILWLFGRLLLVAPMMARGEKTASRRSWRLTKGHGGRLFALQLAALLPCVAGAAASLPLPPVVGAAVNLAGIVYSLWLYTQLGEDEYKRLAIAGSYASSR